MKVREVIHEVLRNEHRVVLLLEDGTIKDGDWVSTSEVASNGKYLSIVGESKLPQGVFTCNPVVHRVLG